MVEIFFCDVSELSPEDETLRGYLSQYRKAALERLRGEAARKLSVGAELLLCYAVKKHTALCPPLPVSVSPAGKPYLDNVFFSLSHSVRHAACAISDLPVGLDIERIAPVKNLNIGRKFLTPAEQARLTQENFFFYWTRKESFIKLNGFSRKPSFFDFEVTEDVTRSDQFPPAYLYTQTADGCCISAASPALQSPALFEVPIKKIINFLKSY